MKRNIDTYIRAIEHDNREFIVNAGYDSIADYIITNAENTGYWHEFFEPEEYESTGDPTPAQIEELKEYLNRHYNYMPG